MGQSKYGNKSATSKAGSIKKPRSLVRDVWVFRYLDGEVQRSEFFGTVDKLTSKAAARKEAGKKLAEINERNAGIKISGLCDRFKRECDKTDSDFRPHTSATYKSFPRRVATTGASRVSRTRLPISLRSRNGSTDSTPSAPPDRFIPDRIAKGKLIPGKTIPGQPPRPASKKTKLHVKAFLHLLFEWAMKWKLLKLGRNLATLIKVKGSKKKVRPATIITRDQWIALTTDWSYAATSAP